MSEVKWIRLYRGNGILYWETPYVNDQPHGVEKKYYKDGTLEWEVSFINGQPHGIQRRYHRDGTLRDETLWIRDKQRDDLLGDENRLLRLTLLGEEV